MPCENLILPPAGCGAAPRRWDTFVTQSADMVNERGRMRHTPVMGDRYPDGVNAQK
jgi:hypothetical protein